MSLFKGLYRVMVLQETGEEMCARDGLTFEQASELCGVWLDDHPEHREAWVEKMEACYEP